jgi:hypothetical protein
MENLLALDELSPRATAFRDIMGRNGDLLCFLTLCRESALSGVTSSTTTTWSIDAGNDNVAARIQTQTLCRTTVAAK